jgi:hypothetical protein
MSVHREPGWHQGRKRFLSQLPLWFYIYKAKQKAISIPLPSVARELASK